MLLHRRARLELGLGTTPGRKEVNPVVMIQLQTETRSILDLSPDRDEISPEKNFLEILGPTAPDDHSGKWSFNENPCGSRGIAFDLSVKKCQPTRRGAQIVIKWNSLRHSRSLMLFRKYMGDLDVLRKMKESTHTSTRVRSRIGMVTTQWETFGSNRSENQNHSIPNHSKHSIATVSIWLVNHLGDGWSSVVAATCSYCNLSIQGYLNP